MELDVRSVMLVGVLLSALLLGVYARGGLAWMLGFVALVPWLLAMDGVRTVRGALASGLLAWRYGLVERDATHLDLVAGVRVWSARVRLAYAVPVPTPPPVPQQYSGEQSHRWVDAQVGVKGRHGFGNGVFVGGWVLAGAGESDLSTDLMLLAGYDINERFAVIAGYRRLSTDFETGGGFRFDTTMQGPGLGLEYRF